MVFSRRSSADGRDSYYVLDLGRCGELLADAGVALHPGLLATRAGFLLELIEHTQAVEEGANR